MTGENNTCKPSSHRSPYYWNGMESWVMLWCSYSTQTEMCDIVQSNLVMRISCLEGSMAYKLKSNVSKSDENLITHPLCCHYIVISLLSNLTFQQGSLDAHCGVSSSRFWITSRGQLFSLFKLFGLHPLFYLTTTSETKSSKPSPFHPLHYVWFDRRLTIEFFQPRQY